MAITQIQFLAYVLGLCSAFNGSITSWWRSERRNNKVGGHEHSQHLTGDAVDIVFDDPLVIPNVIIKALELGLHPVAEKDHVHIQRYSAEENARLPHEVKEAR